MREIFNHLESLEAEFAQHRFFAQLPDAENPSFLLRDVGGLLAFWVSAFQDVLQMNCARMTDPAMKRLVVQHAVEEGGHDVWLYDDLRALGVDVLDARTLFHKKALPTRETAYRIATEVIRMTNDVERVTLLLAMEATGHVFFAHVARFVRENQSVLPPLRFFSDFHLGHEENHEIFEEEIKQFLLAQKLPPDELNACLALVNRVFEAFELMLDGFVARLPVAA